VAKKFSGTLPPHLTSKSAKIFMKEIMKILDKTYEEKEEKRREDKKDQVDRSNRQRYRGTRKEDLGR